MLNECNIIALMCDFLNDLLNSASRHNHAVVKGREASRFSGLAHRTTMLDFPSKPAMLQT